MSSPPMLAGKSGRLHSGPLGLGEWRGPGEAGSPLFDMQRKRPIKQRRVVRAGKQMRRARRKGWTLEDAAGVVEEELAKGGFTRRPGETIADLMGRAYRVPASEVEAAYAALEKGDLTLLRKIERRN